MDIIGSDATPNGHMTVIGTAQPNGDVHMPADVELHDHIGMGDTPFPPDADGINIESVLQEEEIPRKKAMSKRMRKLCAGMTLGLAYSANVGGTGTVTGTTPNIIMKNEADQ